MCGDPRHGQRVFWDAPRLALHAMRLGFVHPRTRERMTFESPLPADLVAWIAELDAIRAELS